VAAGAVLFLIGVGIGAAGSGSSTEADPVGNTVTTAAGTVTNEVTVADEVTVQETVTTVKTEVKPPPSHGVKVNYGDWQGLFKIHGAQVVSSYGSPSVIGQFEYLGGGDCKLGYVEVGATFFNSKGKIVSTGLWNATTVPKGARLPMEVLSTDEVPATRAELVVTDASCD
jgi:hypothetical protein